MLNAKATKTDRWTGVSALLLKMLLQSPLADAVAPLVEGIWVGVRVPHVILISHTCCSCGWRVHEYMHVHI